MSFQKATSYSYSQENQVEKHLEFQHSPCFKKTMGNPGWCCVLIRAVLFIFFLPLFFFFNSFISKECQVGWEPHFFVASGIIFYPLQWNSTKTKLWIQLGRKGRLSDECIFSKQRGGGGRFKFWNIWICLRWFFTLYHPYHPCMVYLPTFTIFYH